MWWKLGKGSAIWSCTYLSPEKKKRKKEEGCTYLNIFSMCHIGIVTLWNVINGTSAKRSD